MYSSHVVAYQQVFVIIILIHIFLKDTSEFCEARKWN